MRPYAHPGAWRRPTWRSCTGRSFADTDLPFARGLDRARWQVLAQMSARGVNSPPTSSLGRLFDAAAALIGLRGEALYEGQAAIELETIAARDQPAYPFNLSDGAPFEIDVRPMLAALVADLRARAPAPAIAGRFHASVAEFLAAGCARVRAASGIEAVALSGGVFQNRLLLERLSRILLGAGFRVYTNRRVPPRNDGGSAWGRRLWRRRACGPASRGRWREICGDPHPLPPSPKMGEGELSWHRGAGASRPHHNAQS